MPGYNVFRKDRVKGKGGGALLYIRDTLKCEQIEWLKETQLECVGVKVTLSSEMSFFLICLYRHPSATVEFHDQLKETFNACNFNKEVIVFGDLNINWDDKKCRKRLKQITEQYNLSQMVQEATRITNHSKTRIDLLFTNRVERISKMHNFFDWHIRS